MSSFLDFFVNTLRTYPELAVFLTLAIGFWFGSLKLGTFSMGTVTSTLTAGLLVGQLHISVAPVVESTFFLMFLFAVGYSVGPQFFQALKKDGLPQVFFTLIVCASGLLTAYMVARLMHFNAGLAAGLLAGGYTNSGTLGVATGYLKQLNSGAVQAGGMAGLTAIAYAVTYPFGAAGAAWILSSLAPRLLRIDLQSSCKELEKKVGGQTTEPGVAPWYRGMITRAYRLENGNLAGRAAGEVGSILGHSDVFVRRIRQNGAIVEADSATVIQKSATLALAGPRPAQVAAEEMLGPEIDDVELLSFPMETLDVIVTNQTAADSTISDLQEMIRSSTGHQIVISGLTRRGRKTDFTSETKLQRHDALTLVGARGDVEKAAGLLGYADRAGITSDIAFMSIAVTIGGLIGAIALRFGGIRFTLSPSVGALLAGLVCGQLRSVYRTFGRVPAPALWVFNNVGLNGFVAVVGLNAAMGLVAGLKTYGVGLFVSGMCVTLVPLIVGLVLGKFIFKFHPAILLGACAGARSTTAGLGAIQEAANSTVPAIGYTIPYTVSRIVMAVAGIIIIALMR